MQPPSKCGGAKSLPVSVNLSGKKCESVGLREMPIWVTVFGSQDAAHGRNILEKMSISKITLVELR